MAHRINLITGSHSRPQTPSPETCLVVSVLRKAKNSHILEAVIKMLLILVQDYILEDVASSPGWTLDSLTRLGMASTNLSLDSRLFSRQSEHSTGQKSVQIVSNLHAWL